MNNRPDWGSQHWTHLFTSSLIKDSPLPLIKAVYQSGWRQYQRFCHQFNITPLPLTEHSQTAFAAYLSQSISAGTVRSYLFAIRFYQIWAGLPDPNIPCSPKLSYVLKGIHMKSSGHIRPQRLPITPSLLTQIHALWSKQPYHMTK